MRNLLAGNWAEVSLSQAATKSNVSSVISAYLQWQLERGLRSMSMVERA
jgi:DNA repair protein RecO (recombination protein O)